MHYPNYVHKNNKDMRIHVKNNDEMLLWKLQMDRSTHYFFIIWITDNWTIITKFYSNGIPYNTTI